MKLYFVGIVKKKIRSSFKLTLLCVSNKQKEQKQKSILQAVGMYLISFYNLKQALMGVERQKLILSISQFIIELNYSDYLNSDNSNPI